MSGGEVQYAWPSRQHVISVRPRVVGLLRSRTGHAVAMFLRARLLAVHTRRHAQHRLILFARAPLSTTSTQMLQPQTRGLVISAVVGCGGSAALYYSRCSCETSSLLEAPFPAARLKRTLSHDAAMIAAEQRREQSQSPLSVVIRTLRSIARLLYLCAVLGPLVLTLPLSKFSYTSDAWWACCCAAFENSGALLIKLAQWSSSRPDLFGEVVCARLKHLQDSTTPHSWRATERALAKHFGDDWRERLRVTSPEAILGSGCIAQVYQGELRDPSDGTWRPVAIKVLHPGVREFVTVDMELLRGVGWLLDHVPKLHWLNPSGMLTEFAQLLLMQLDLTIEAHNLDKFRRNFDPNTSAITFPEPMRPFVSTDVLVESYVEGTPFHLWASAHNPPEASRRRVCSTLSTRRRRSEHNWTVR